MDASMLSLDGACDPEPLSRAAADYAVVRRAIAFVCEHWRAQPEIDAIAAAAGVSASELHHLFRRWAAIGAPSAPQSARIHSRSWCPAIACWAKMAHSPATTGD